LTAVIHLDRVDRYRAISVPSGRFPVNFSEAKLRQLDAAATYRVYGHEIEFGGGAADKSAKTARRRWRLISPCFCVWDSPDSPCPCMTDESRWWLRVEAVVDEGKAGRKDHDGQELQFFDVLVDSKIMMESLQPVSAGTLKRLGDKIRVGGLVTSPPGGSGSIAMVEEVVLGIVLGLLLLDDAGVFDSVTDLIDKAKAKRGLS
jgi:hypothetical protein